MEKRASLQVFSPAKINLNLAVLNRREDGYHSLETVMHTISLGDFLFVECSEIDEFLCSDSKLPQDASNLCLKARDLFRKKTDIRQPVSISLLKNIPAEAGLGGGSSNAATVLWAMRELLASHIPDSDLMLWSAEIGSDIPFFFSHGCALCQGRGELVSDLPLKSAETVVLVKPDFGLSTKAVFETLKLPAKRIEGAIFNDLEEAAFSLHPELRSLHDELKGYGFSSVHMTGSGSALVCLGADKVDLGQLKRPFYTCHFMGRNEGSWYEAPL